MTVLLFIAKALEGQRAPFLPEGTNGFLIYHEGPDDGPKAFSGCSRPRGEGAEAPGAGLAPFWGRFWPFFINGN